MGIWSKEGLKELAYMRTRNEYRLGVFAHMSIFKKKLLIWQALRGISNPVAKNLMG